MNNEERITRIEAVVDKTADNINRLDEAMLSLAESEIRTNQRIDQLAIKFNELADSGKRTDERIQQLVSAMGVLIQRLPAQQ